jgi:hypothetical protein
MVRRLQLRNGIRWWETQLPLIAPNSIPVDQLQGSDDITGGRRWEGRLLTHVAAK